jgi:acyl-CoA thioester hydrolase
MRPELAAEVRIAPAFHDLDPMDIVWHGNYVRYFEHARTALLQQLDYDYPQMKASGYAWPIVDLRIKYIRSAGYLQALIARAEIVEWENRLKIDYLIRDAASGTRITRASTIQVAVEIATRELQFVCPPILWQKLGVAPP